MYLLYLKIVCLAERKILKLLININRPREFEKSIQEEQLNNL